MEYRIESDFLGEREIPSDAYYGIQTLRASENFCITGYKIHSSIIVSLAIVKKSCALANRDVGLLDDERAEAISKACDKIIDGEYHEQFIVDPIQGGAGTSINMNANEVIANVALEILGREKGDYAFLSPNSHVNMAQSTNDAFPTSMHLAILMNIDKLEEVVEELADTFAAKAEEFSSVIKMGRTHLQDAVPIRLGQEFKAYEAVIRRDLARIESSGNNLQEVNIGATAVGTGLNALPKYIEKCVYYLSEFSGYKIKTPSNLVDATQNTDEYTHISAVLKICMTNMSKIANDIRLMASGPRAGLNELSLPARQPGSSIMPGKVNPVMPEMINQVAFQVIGNDHTISMASEAGQFELNVMEPVLFFNLIQSLSIMSNGLKLFNDKCLKDIQANVDIMSGYVERSFGILTAVNPHIGYEKSSKIAYEAIKTGQNVRELVLKHGLLTSEELDIILEPYSMTDVGISGFELLNEKNKK